MRLHWLSLLLVPLATLVLLPARDHLQLASVLLIHLLAVVCVAVLSTTAAAAAAAILAVVLTTWFYTRPYGSLDINNLSAVIDLAAFLAVALTTSVLLRRSRHHEAVAERAVEERDIVQELDRSRAALLAALGHDLRGPISTIKATSSGVLAQDVAWSPQDIAEAWRLVDDESDRLADLLSNLLDQARLEAGTPIAQTLAVEVADVLRSKRLPRVARRYSLPADLPMVIADPGLMERVVHNLLVNAQRHGGTDVDVVISAQRVDDQVVITFDDNGRGVSAERLTTLFDPYVASGDRSPGGSGLGLAIVRGFVEAMGGTVAAAASPRGGLRILITLRVAP